MSTIDEIFATISEADATASVDEILVIDPNTREINLPGSELIFGVESDTYSERKYFQCPRYVGDNVDLSSCFIRVNYRNANGEVDAYLIDDVTVAGDNIMFSWLLSKKVTAYKGQVKFVVCASRPGGKGAKPIEWNTTMASGLSLEGIEPDHSVVEAATTDAIAQLLSIVEVQTDNVEAEGARQINVVKTAAEAEKTAMVAEIEAKGTNTLARIPADYTALSGAVNELTRTVAPGIVCEAEGEVISLNDASDSAVKNIKIFGKSTQDGTPTPDAPVEIMSVDKPVVTVAGKNLVKNGAKSETLKGVKFTVNEDGSFTAKGTATGEIYYGIDFAVENVLPGVRYRLSGCPAGGSASTYRLYAQTSDGKNFAGDVGLGTSFTGTSDQWQVLFVIYGGATVDFTVHPMLRLATVEDSTYEPYSAQTVELTHTLPGIPVSSGGNYTDSDGQQWVCDEVDLERGVYVQRVYTENCTLGHDVSAGRYTGSTTYSANPNCITGSGIPVLCNILPFHSEAANGTATNGIRISAAGTKFIAARYDNAVLSKVTLSYPLATPIETPLTETELAAYRVLHTNKPNTTILNDGGAHMAVEYVADTKLYIDNKIATLVSGM